MRGSSVPVVTLALASALALAGCASTRDAAAPPATASVRTAEPRHSGGDLAQRLATFPWRPGELPERATAGGASREDRPGPAGALAEIGFRIDKAATARPGEINVILYGVFDTRAHAQAAFARGPQTMVNPADHTTFSREPAPGFTSPAALFHLEVTDIHGSGTPVMGYSYCTLLQGTILISGGSGIPGATAHGDDRHACTLASDAMAHLQRLS